MNVAFSITFIAMILVGHSVAHEYRPPFCKYSVRDVAFVNVHGNAWQVQLIKPNSVDGQTFVQWNEVLRRELNRSNVEYLWLDPSFEGAGRSRSISERSSNSPLPVMGLTSPDGRLLELLPNKMEFADAIKSLVHSPARNEILNAVGTALCVFLFVECGNHEKDARTREQIDLAIKQINRQKWMMEKPTEVGPQFVVIPRAARAAEHWLLESLDMANFDEPAIAIVYGQGRRLGDVLLGDNISVEQLVNLASICGRSCECDLDRSWLYGRQMIHYWTEAHERLAESSLTFDPNSALVIAEVSQIIRKSTLASNSPAIPRLDQGLIIHEFTDDDAQDRQIEKLVDANSNMTDNIDELSKKSEFEHSSKETEPAVEQDSLSETVYHTVWNPLPIILCLILLAAVVAGLAFIRRQ